MVLNESKRKFVIVLVFIFSCLLTAALILPFMGNTDLSSELITEDSIVFTPDDGSEPITFSSSPDEIEFRLDGVYTSTYTLQPDDSDERQLRFMIGSGEAEIFVDGELVCSETLQTSDAMFDAPNCIFSLDANTAPMEIVTNVRYTNPTSYMLPGLLSMSRPGMMARWYAALTNTSAIPAGIAGFGFLVIMILFLMTLSISAPDYSLPFLAFGLLCFCVMRLYDTGALIYSLPVLYFLRYQVLPYAAAALVLIYIIWNRKSKVMKYFLFFSGAACVLIIASGILQHVLDNVPIAILEFSQIARLFSNRQFDSMFRLISNYLVIVCVLTALVYYIRNMMEVVSEKVRLENRERAIMTGYESIVESVKETMAVRHEWKHDLLTLSLLYEQDKIAEIGAYLQEKNKFFKKNELEASPTGCFVLDVILSFASSRARSEDVRLQTYVSVPGALPIKEETLCQLLLNMLDNAFHACTLVEKDRFIDFSIELKGAWLTIRCSNSFSAVKPAKSNGPQHGYGIRNMKKICEAYGSDLLIDTQTEGVFTVKTALHLDEIQEVK